MEKEMEKELVKQTKKGNKQAFEELILLYHKDLYKIAKVRLFIEEDINDAIQETIISAYQSISSLHNISKFKYWLIKILINKCNEICRKRKRENNISFELVEADKYVSQNYNIESDLEFYNIIECLNLDERTILILYYVEGYKPKEIAKILHINGNTVRSKLLRGKNKIKNNLKEFFEYE